MKRKTVTFSDDLHERIQKLRGKLIAESGEAVPFSRIVEELVAAGLSRRLELVREIREAATKAGGNDIVFLHSLNEILERESV